LGGVRSQGRASTRRQELTTLENLENSEEKAEQARAVKGRCVSRPGKGPVGGHKGDAKKEGKTMKGKKKKKKGNRVVFDPRSYASALRRGIRGEEKSRRTGLAKGYARKRKSH